MYLSRKYILIKLLIFSIIWIHVLGRRKRKIQDKSQPEIVSAQLYYDVRLNGTVCLPCSIKKQYEGAYKILTYWRKGMQTVITWPRYHFKGDCLEITNILSSDHGNYTCVAINKLGKTEVSRILRVIDRKPVNFTSPPTTKKPSTIIDPPDFFIDTIQVKTPLVKKSFNKGEKAKLRCRIDGSPLPKIYWLHNGRVLDRSVKYRLRPLKKLLVIRNFTKKDGGNYTCVGNNSDGVRNMTFIVDIKTIVPTSPMQSTPTPTKYVTPEYKEIRITTGSNVTLTCHAPLKKLRYLIWTHGSGKNRRRGRQYESKDLSDTKTLPFFEFHKTRNGTRIEHFMLLNVSKAVHSGEYHCIGVFKKQKPVKMKIVKVIVEAHSFTNKDQLKNNQDFPLNIVLPAGCVAFFLLIIFLCICIVCSRKAQNTKGLLLAMQASTQQHDNLTEPAAYNDEQLTMQILPMCNYDSLRKHKPRCERNPSISKSSYCSSVATLNSRTPTPCNRSKTSLNINDILFADANDLQLQDLKSANCYNGVKSSANTTTKNREVQSRIKQTKEAERKENSERPPLDSPKEGWPKERLESGDADYIDYVSENNKLLANEYPFTERTKKVDQIRKKSNDSSTSMNNNRISTKASKPPMQRTFNRSPFEFEEEDKLLQREVKNWEPLIRKSSIVTSLHENNDVSSGSRRNISEPLIQAV